MKYTGLFTIFILSLFLDFIICLSRKRKVFSKIKVGSNPNFAGLTLAELNEAVNKDDFRQKIFSDYNTFFNNKNPNNLKEKLTDEDVKLLITKNIWKEEE